jgi:hypothetical protein
MRCTGVVLVVVVVVVVAVVVVDVVVVVPTVVVVAVVPVVVVSASGTGPPANAYAARTPARAQATSRETLRLRFIGVLVTLGQRGIPANPGRS